MLIRCLAVCALAFGLPAPIVAQGELSQCQGADKRQVYPCRLAGGVVRSQNDHIVQEKSLETTGKLVDQSVFDRGNDKDDLLREVLKLLLDD